MKKDELDLLPENDFMDYEVIELPSEKYPQGKPGDTLVVRKPKKGRIMRLSANSLIYFDSEGRRWTVGEIDRKKYKQRVWL